MRLTNWVCLQDRKSGREFRVMNTHLDCDSQPARVGQARCMVEDANAYPADYPQLLTGDMNCDVTNEAIALFKANGWRDTYGAVRGDERARWARWTGFLHVARCARWMRRL